MLTLMASSSQSADGECRRRTTPIAAVSATPATAQRLVLRARGGPSTAESGAGSGVATVGTGMSPAARADAASAVALVAGRSAGATVDATSATPPRTTAALSNRSDRLKSAPDQAAF